MFSRVLVLSSRSILLCPSSQAIRTISTSSILSKSYIQKFTKNKYKSKNKSKSKSIQQGYIIEEPRAYQDSNIQKYYNEISSYISHTESSSLSERSKTNVITTKLTELLLQLKIDNNNNNNDDDDAILEVLELTIKNGFNKKVPLELAVLIFEKLHNIIIAKQPSFSSAILETLLGNIEKLPNSTLIQLINYTQDSKTTKLSSILKSLQDRIDYESFMKEYLAYLADNEKFSLSVFEELVELGSTDETITYLNRYIENLFKENMPEVHCYLNLEYNLDRIQMVINNSFDKLEFNKISTESLLKLFKLNWEILNASKCQASSENSDKVLNYLQDKTSQVKEVIFKQDLEDESLVEILLFASWNYSNKMLANELTEFVSKDDVKFLELLRFQLEVYKLVHKNNNISNLLDNILSLVPESADPSQAYEKIIQAMMTSDISPINEIINELSSKLVTEKSIYSYKYRIDRAIEMNDHEIALQIFNDSVDDFVPWAQYNNDPSITRTLNDLIQCVVNNKPMKQAFPIFQNIKAQLQQQINIDTINAIVPKILQENLSGDVIELMSRELPKIDQESSTKFPIEKPYGYKYYQLYDTVHTYCITNTADSKMVNNWYLYVHCYNYFFIPHDRLLPTMKFFCKHERWNGALRIFRTMLKMSQLHGEHNHRPPTKEMYMFLINEFGDKLYEEGVVEIHESLKMDIALPTQDKELIHSIMNAYCNLQEVGKVRDLFLTMSLQPKDDGGVDETSATIMIKAYTYNDLMYVDKFWNNLTTFGLVPDYTMFKQYLIAHSYHGAIDKSIEIVEGIEDYELEFTDDLLINMYNYCYEIDGQQKLSRWAKSTHPKLWEQALESGKLIDASGYKPNENFLVDGSKNDPKRLNEPIFK